MRGGVVVSNVVGSSEPMNTINYTTNEMITKFKLARDTVYAKIGLQTHTERERDTHIHTHTERERKRERERDTHTHTHTV